MKIGFSSIAVPAWDLPTVVSNAASMGFDGVELRGLGGQLDLVDLPALTAHPERVRDLCGEHGVELVCLSSSVTLDSKDRREVARQKAALEQYLELASRLGVPFVRIFAGEVQRTDNLQALQARVVDALLVMAPLAGRLGVTVLVENGGDLCDSASAWYIVDAVGHPSVRCCWNQCLAMTGLERPTTSIPRLGRKLGMLHVCDAQINDEGLLVEYRLLGAGNVGIDRQIELLRGIVYRGYLMFEWPRLWQPALADADEVLPAAAAWLRARLESKQAVLSAYKGDKRPTKFRDLPEESSTS